MKEGNNLYEIYMTTPDKDEAKMLASVLVAERLAACVNIVPGLISVYEWQEEVENEEECVMFIKTTAEKVDNLIERMKDLHSYDCPCIVGWPIENGYPAYIKWVNEVTEKQ